MRTVMPEDNLMTPSKPTHNISRRTFAKMLACSAVMVSPSMLLPDRADAVTLGDFEYTTRQAGQTYGPGAVITQYTGQGPLTVPLELDGYPVTAVVHDSEALFSSVSVTDHPTIQCVFITWSSSITSCSFVRCAALREIQLSSSTLNALTVTSCTTLETLYATGGILRSLAGITGCPRLSSLNASYNSLGNFSYPQLSSLRTLIVSECNLSSISLAGYASLEVLNTGYNRFTSLDLSSCVNLQSLISFSGQISSINVAACAKAKKIYIQNNKITYLDLSSNVLLTELNCMNNRLSSLDISNNPVLDVSKCYCRDNRIIDVSALQARGVPDANIFPQYPEYEIVDTVEDFSYHSNTFGTDAVLSSMVWKDEWFSTSPTEYNHKLATIAMAFSTLAYSGDEQIRAALVKLGFTQTDILVNPSQYVTGDDKVGFTLATKKINVSGRTRRLLVVVVRGTSDGTEWRSNMDVWDRRYPAGEISLDEVPKGEHFGFKNAADLVLQAIRQWFDDKMISRDELGSFGKVLVTGHSRGAVVANSLATTLQNGNLYQYSDIYAYAFATPNFGVNPSGAFNVHNIINIEDFVPRSPLALWGYGKNGQMYYLPSVSNCDATYYSGLKFAMNSVFRQMTGVDFASYPDGASPTEGFVSAVGGYASQVVNYYDTRHGPDQMSSYDFFMLLADFMGDQSNGSKQEALFNATLSDFPAFILYFVGEKFLKLITHSHCPEAYLSWMKSQENRNDLFQPYHMTIALEGISSLQVLSQGSEKILVDIADGEIQEIENGLPAYIDGHGIMTITLPSDEEVSLSALKGFLPDVLVSVSRTLSDGEAEYVVLAANGSNDSARVVGTVTSDNTVSIVDAISLSSEELKFELREIKVASDEIEITAVASDGGTVSGGGLMQKGESAIFEAFPDEGMRFVGWRTGDDVVSTDSRFAYTAQSSVAIVAQFDYRKHIGECKFVASSFPRSSLQHENSNSTTLIEGLSMEGEALVPGRDYEVYERDVSALSAKSIGQENVTEIHIEGKGDYFGEVVDTVMIPS